MVGTIKDGIRWVADKGAESAGAHAELNVLNRAYQREIDKGYCLPLDILRGANLACSPANEKLGEGVNYLVTNGAKNISKITLDNAFGEPNTISGIAKGVLGAGELTLGLAAPALTDDYMGYANLGFNAYNYLTSSNDTPGSRVIESDQVISQPTIDQNKLTDTLGYLKDLNAREVTEVQQMLKSLTGEKATERRWNEAGELVEKIIIDSAIETVSGALGNLTKLGIMNGAYDATVALSGATAKHLTEGAGEFISGLAEKTARGAAHAFVAAPVAVSTPVKTVGNFCRDQVEDGSSNLLRAGYNYAKKLDANTEPSLAKTALKVGGLAALGAATCYVAPGTLAKNTFTVLGGKAMDVYRQWGVDTPDEVADKKALEAMNAVCAEEANSVHDAKVTAAFIKLANLNHDEMNALADLAKTAPQETIAEEVIVEEVSLPKVKISEGKANITGSLSQELIADAIKSAEAVPTAAACA